jgi:protoheme IX farnesyltransferase
LNLLFLYQALRLYWTDEKEQAMRVFRYSIHYLGILFLLLVVDHFFK